MVTMAKKAKKDKTDAVVVTPEEAASVADNTSEDDNSKPKKKKKKNKDKKCEESVTEQMDTPKTEDVSDTPKRKKVKSEKVSEIQTEAVISQDKKPKNEKGSHVRSAKERMKVCGWLKQQTNIFNFLILGGFLLYFLFPQCYSHSTA